MVTGHTISTGTSSAMGRLDFVGTPLASRIESITMTLTQDATAPECQFFLGTPGFAETIANIDLNPSAGTVDISFGSSGSYSAAMVGDGLPHTWEILSDGDDWQVLLDGVQQYTHSGVVLPAGIIGNLDLYMAPGSNGHASVDRLTITTRPAPRR